MRTKFLATVAVAAGLLATAASAQATTIGGGPNVTGTDDGNVTLTNTASGNAVNCASSTLSGTVSTSGSGNLSGATFTSCTYGFTNATVTANQLPWPAVVAWNGGNPTLAVTVDEVQVDLFGCSFDADGTVTGDITDGSSVDSVAFTGAGPLDISNVSGWSCGSSVSNGDDAELDGEYILEGDSGPGALTISS